jgi:hypothetical protein
MKSIVFADKPFLQRAAFHLSVGRKGAGKGTVNAGWSLESPAASSARKRK